MSLDSNSEFLNYPNASRVKQVKKHGRKITVPWGHVDTVIDDNMKCPVCLQYSLFPIFLYRGTVAGERDFGQPVGSPVLLPGMQYGDPYGYSYFSVSDFNVRDDRDDLFDPSTYKRGSQDNLDNARTILECINTRCPNRASGMRFRQVKALEDFEL